MRAREILKSLALAFHFLFNKFIELTFSFSAIHQFFDLVRIFCNFFG